MDRQSRSFAGLVGALLRLACLLLTLATFASSVLPVYSRSAASPGPVNQAFDRAAHEFGVPASLLKAICYMEGRLSNHGGSPSVDNGFGCMHLVHNAQVDTLDRVARELKVSADQLKLDLLTSIRGGAVLLWDYARQLSGAPQVSTNLSDWYGAVAAYSNATTRATALMYADEVYTLLHQGFTAQADDGETVTLTPQMVRPRTVTAAGVTGRGTGQLPRGCTKDNLVDYPEAIDCIVPPDKFDCNQVKKQKLCTYESANRPTDEAVDLVVIHDIEGTAQSSLDVFQNPASQASAHYIVDTDGTVYQIVHDADIAYHAGNYWYNQHSIGIEHAGFDASGYRWYNATEYLASARLTAYILHKYNIPLDHAHVVSHGTIPSPSATILPNHVDPGPYWLWDYYLHLIHQQGVPFPNAETMRNVITLHPRSARRLLGPGGTESRANFAFFYLYNGPSTRSGLIPQQGSSADIADVTSSVETDLSFYYVAKTRDRGRSGDTMYEIWYGVEDQAHASQPTRFAHARLVWLAVPPGGANRGQGTPVKLTTSDGSDPIIYGRPVTDTSTTAPPPNTGDAMDQSSSGALGSAPNGAIFVSAYTVTEDNTQNLWYEINYNHRQAWVPASEVTLLSATNSAQPPTF